MSTERLPRAETLQAMEEAQWIGLRSSFEDPRMLFAELENDEIRDAFLKMFWDEKAGVFVAIGDRIYAEGENVEVVIRKLREVLDDLLDDEDAIEHEKRDRGMTIINGTGRPLDIDQLIRDVEQGILNTEESQARKNDHA